MENTDGPVSCKLDDSASPATDPDQAEVVAKTPSVAPATEEDHPRKKIENENNKSAEPKKRGRGRSPTHGLSKSSIYTSFREAKARCTNPKHPDYQRYGGRGIEFRFGSPAELLDAVGQRPAGHTLDRIDPDGHYETGNVRWATPKQQANKSQSTGVLPATSVGTEVVPIPGRP